MNPKPTPPDPMRAYYLGLDAGLLLKERPRNWQHQLRANFREAKKQGVTISLRRSEIASLPKPAKP